MIITRIIPHAGIGNQMFMYAAGLAAASRLNTELFIASWNIENFMNDRRPYHLKCFPNINERRASLPEILGINAGRFILKRISRRPRRKYDLFGYLLREISTKLLIQKNIYAPSWCSYNEDFMNIQDNTYIRGFFESEKIFYDIQELVRKKFMFSQQCFNPELVQRVQSCNSAALHVRRTDKVNNSSHIDSKSDYIKAAMTKIFSLTSEPEFFVFSDDINWCKENLSKIYPDAKYNFIENQTPAQDMALMTKCRHVITGPSTFSWWGAWLNENPDKIIIAPAINLWFTSYKPDRKYLLPERWIKIS